MDNVIVNSGASGVGEGVRDVRPFAVIDSDVHSALTAVSPDVVAYLPQRWRDHVAEFGAVRPGAPGGDRPREREFANRWGTEPPGGGAPGSNPVFAREQHLDKYQLSGAMLNDTAGFAMSGARQQPPGLTKAFCRAMNEHRRDYWLASDPRWYGSITVPYELPEAAAAEVKFCMEDSGDHRDRWKQVLLAPDNVRPVGHESYWPLFEVCEHYDLPIAFHVLTQNRITSSGPANYYFEEHTDFALSNFPIVSSMIFGGAFERFPNLKVVMLELGWSWAVPFAWRLDHAQRMLGHEVPHMSRRASEYLADHFWYTTQPMEEPDESAWFDEILDAHEKSGMADKLLYSSDYPHWDFDEPAALPKTLSDEQFERILGKNASKLYGIETIDGQGYLRP